VVLRKGEREDLQDASERGRVMEWVIGFIGSLVLLATMGFGLPRWFEWRRSLATRWPGEPEDGV
jgi:hypothetical protein